MTIYVVGNCKAIPLADCLTLMCPGVRVERLAPDADPGGKAGAGDLVLRQRAGVSLPAPSGPATEIVYPRIWFNGFHPDVVFVRGPWGTVRPPVGNNQSSIVLYAWQRGLSVADTVRLFCEPVFERLGFFASWEPAKRALIEEGDAVGFPLGGILERLRRRGCFMHSPLHPALVVSAEIARAVADRAALRVAFSEPESFLHDAMLHKGVWPVYPLIAERLGLRGSYAFKPPNYSGALPTLFDLEETVARSFAAYASVPPEALWSYRFESPLYRDLELHAYAARPAVRESVRPAASNGAPASPYADLPDERFWRRAVASIPAGDVDPVGVAPFRIRRDDAIATIGSCFAQTMSRGLERYGYRHYVAEQPPDALSEGDARAAGYGVFTTRSGNVYTARQLLQLARRAYGEDVPVDSAWERHDGRWADPFRPQIEPGGFASVEELLASRERHLAAVRTMFERLDVLVVTLGLTEAWRSTVDGAVFPLAPGVVAGRLEPGAYEFVNFDVAEVRDDVVTFLGMLAAVNPNARVVLTVSPQPQIATYEPEHVLVAATYSKAVLRAAIGEVARTRGDVWYFPSYEIVTGPHARRTLFEPDLRTVTPQGADRVMRLFLAHAGSDDGPRHAAVEAMMSGDYQAAMAVVCDEETLAFDERRSEEADARSGAVSAWQDFAWFRDFGDFER